MSQFEARSVFTYVSGMWESIKIEALRVVHVFFPFGVWFTVQLSVK